MIKLINILAIVSALLSYLICGAQSSQKYIEVEWKNGSEAANLYMDGNDPEKLKSIVDTMNNKYVDLNTINNKVIALAFSQLFLEGHIESEVKKWAEAASSRELIYLDFWNVEKGEMRERQERIDQLLSDLRKG
ncbi:hypothetical protein D1632_17310 [Chryseobacterium nematophagum]|uniref:DUF4476 domain-containing protein n=1 Tax=Chryseobacterium nematophagum TaxID=2305228 RepID=A0A3M7L778_9FLAO|nr:hypothetical protein [Chryseobacterium nematophagum]RMZ58049.1 hypothetical protein D1632_17310 [Chryseobacterium nematophagum]